MQRLCEAYRGAYAVELHSDVDAHCPPHVRELLLSLLSVLPALHVYRLWFASGGEDAAESEEEDEEEDEAARRRAANIEMHGEDSARERAATNAFANAWNDLFPGLRAVTLNDFTLADLLALDIIEPRPLTPL